jgi:hypothetical protein
MEEIIHRTYATVFNLGISKLLWFHDIKHFLNRQREIRRKSVSRTVEDLTYYFQVKFYIFQFMSYYTINEKDVEPGEPAQVLLADGLVDRGATPDTLPVVVGRVRPPVRLHLHIPSQRMFLLKYFI